jgi:hypothetical protein
LDLAVLGHLSSLASLSTFLGESLPNVRLRGKFTRDDLHITLLDATNRVQPWSQVQRSELTQLNVLLIAAKSQQAEPAASTMPVAAAVLAAAEFASNQVHHFTLHSPSAETPLSVHSRR